MLKTYLPIALITLFFFTLPFEGRAEDGSVPRLTVVVVADGLTEDNLVQLRPYWLTDGMASLGKETYITSLTLDHRFYGGHEALASLLTGTSPREHGWAMDTVFDRATRRTKALLEDKRQRGIGTPLTLSLESLLSATIADEYRLDYGSKAKIYAVGLHPTSTMLLAGHAANACCWWDNRKEQWVSSTYYSEGLPSPADEWNMNGKKKESLTLNERVTQLGLEIQRTQKMGLDEVPDILLLEYDLGLDDANLDVLMNQLILRVGRYNLQLLVLGTPQGEEASAFNIDRAAALTSTYLIALYGHERWIEGGYGNSIWLNKSLIEQKHLSQSEVESKVCSLLMDFEGVAAAYPIDKAMVLEPTKESVNKHCTGDIVVTLEHGWQYREPKVTMLWWSGHAANYPKGTIDYRQIRHLIYK